MFGLDKKASPVALLPGAATHRHEEALLDARVAERKTHARGDSPFFSLLLLKPAGFAPRIQVRLEWPSQCGRSNKRHSRTGQLVVTVWVLSCASQMQVPFLGGRVSWGPVFQVGSTGILIRTTGHKRFVVFRVK